MSPSYSSSELHYMQLGDRRQFFHYNVLRVPGGWIFEYENAAVFVPYSDEFNGKGYLG